MEKRYISSITPYSWTQKRGKLKRLLLPFNACLRPFFIALLKFLTQILKCEKPSAAYGNRASVLYVMLGDYRPIQGPLTIWTYHSFFCKYNLGPSLKIEYLKSGWEYQRASFIGLKFGISRITRLWFQVFKWLHLWMVWIWKSGFECKFPAPEGIMKNTKKHPTLPDHCDPTTCSKLDYKVPMERGYPYLSFGTFGSKLGSLLWPHWALIQPEANHKMKNHGVISPYPLEVPE